MIVDCELAEERDGDVALDGIGGMGLGRSDCRRGDASAVYRGAGDGDEGDGKWRWKFDSCHHAMMKTIVFLIQNVFGFCFHILRIRR